jgi:hypothetical protein
MRFVFALFLVFLAKIISPTLLVDVNGPTYTNLSIQAELHQSNDLKHYHHWDALEIELEEEESGSEKSKKELASNDIFNEHNPSELIFLHSKTATSLLSHRKGVLSSEPIFILQERFLI